MLVTTHPATEQLSEIIAGRTDRARSIRLHHWSIPGGRQTFWNPWSHRSYRQTFFRVVLTVTRRELKAELFVRAKMVKSGDRLCVSVFTIYHPRSVIYTFGFVRTRNRALAPCTVNPVHVVGELVAGSSVRCPAKRWCRNSNTFTRAKKICKSFCQAKYGVQVNSTSSEIALRSTSALNQLTVEFGLAYGIIKKRRWSL